MIIKDSEIQKIIEKEEIRQFNHLELIASENYTSLDVMSAQGSHLTNKYAEGYPYKRYYGGCEFVDEIETIAIERVKKLFGAVYANVQPHSGSQANQAVFMAVLEPGDTILGMDLASGGHLTHGGKMNISGKIYNAIGYGLDENGYLDYAAIERMAIENKPKLIICGASAYSRVIDFEFFSNLAKRVDAFLLADIAHYAGLIVAGEYPNPIEYADFVTSTTHKTLRGPRGGVILSDKKLITRANKEIDVEKALNSAIFPVLQGGPLMHVIAGKAVCFGEAGTESFKEYAKQVKLNAKVLCNELMKLGLDVVSNGTDSHMFLADLRKVNITGKEAEKVLDEVNITVNKNSIPNDPQKPFVTSGIRIGTPAITTRGMKEDEMVVIAECIFNTLKNPHNQEVKDKTKARVLSLCSNFKLPH